VNALRVLCPTIFLSGLLGVFRGYFQAHQTTLYTSVSQIIEQVFNAIVSVGAAYLFIQPYLSTGGSPLASAGAAGSALGTGAGGLIGLLYMTFMYMKRKNNIIIENEPDDYEDSYKDIFKMILSIVTPIIFATCIYNLVTTIDMYIFYAAMGTGVNATTLYGVYSGEYIVLQNVPVALAAGICDHSLFPCHIIFLVFKRLQTNKRTYKIRYSYHDVNSYSFSGWHECIGLSNYWYDFSSKRNNHNFYYAFSCWKSRSCFLWIVYINKWNPTSYWRSESTIKEFSYRLSLALYNYICFTLFHTIRSLFTRNWKLYLWSSGLLFKSKVFT